MNHAHRASDTAMATKHIHMAILSLMGNLDNF